ncbi:hypothetical protein G7078_10430 [Sphingomonas sinipercae]|uniref:Uncharacterized protein n=1 Tax=Sphingomonas sinipercae TaxID=2714944 RepID=A0A6G7ZQF8_9SPHN|nr:hypothetical protein [Sphingomonas sinipercae]QIL03152.1 hypothetical protein G7078_10430 [Sphingomonas sinipercae]
MAQPPAAPIQVPSELSDPATINKLGNAVQALPGVLLDLKVGELQAALEGRRATAAEKRMTVRDMGRRDDPNFERNLKQQVAQAGPMLEASMKALVAALPQMMGGLQQAADAAKRAGANMPSPTYPKR